jgi:broad specificity polyphosphatase/5'/3'-nucleotidase SurE
MRILVCNDDGFGSPGLEALAAVARSIGDDVWVVSYASNACSSSAGGVQSCPGAAAISSRV